MESGWDPNNAEPNTESIVEDDTLNEEASESTEEEMIEPLLGGVGTMVEDVTSAVWWLLIEVLLTVPVSPHGLWHTKSLSICQSHIANVTLFVVLESSSYIMKQQLVIWFQAASQLLHFELIFKNTTGLFKCVLSFFVLDLMTWTYL